MPVAYLLDLFDAHVALTDRNCQNLLTSCSCCNYFVWRRHQTETFSRYWPFVRGIHRSPVNSPHKGQSRWRGALMFSLICASLRELKINGDLKHCTQLNNWFGNLRPSDAICGQKSWSSLDQVMVCPQFVLFHHSKQYSQEASGTKSTGSRCWN